MSYGANLERLLFPELAAELDRALGEDRGGAAKLDEHLDAAAAAARDAGLGRAAFDGAMDVEAERLEDAFAAAAVVASWAGLRVPEPEEFWRAGSNLDGLARALMADTTLVAVPTPYGLGETRWTELYRIAARQKGTPLALAAPLELAPEVLAEFAALDAPSEGVATVRGDGLTWTLRLIPAGAEPPRTNLNHSHGPHPMLPEMLMLQLMLLVRGKAPIDQQSLTWLAGNLSSGRFAARHLFDTTTRSVRVNTREPGNQGPHLGVRSPISGL